MKFLNPVLHSAPKFFLTANVRDLSVMHFNFMRIMNLNIYMGFDRETTKDIKLHLERFSLSSPL